MNPTPSAGVPESREMVRALVGEYLDERRREVADTSLTDAPRRIRTVLLVVALITCAIVWILPSLYKPPVYKPSPERVEAGTRMTLFLAAERVRSYRREHGGLPATLGAAGVDSVGLAYRVRGDSTFEISSKANGQRLTYLSTMTNAEFLGEALNILSTAP